MARTLTCSECRKSYEATNRDDTKATVGMCEECFEKAVLDSPLAKHYSIYKASQARRKKTEGDNG